MKNDMLDTTRQVFTIAELKALKPGDEVIYFFHDYEHGYHFTKKGKKTKVVKNSITGDAPHYKGNVYFENGYDIDMFTWNTCHHNSIPETLAEYYEGDNTCIIYKP